MENEESFIVYSCYDNVSINGGVQRNFAKRKGHE